MKDVSDPFVPSIMFYEDAIIKAIEDIKDYHYTGSSLESIRKHIQASILNSVGKEIWNSCVFIQALKSLLSKGTLSQSVQFSKSGTCLYTLSKDYKKRRLEEIKGLLKLKERQKRETKEKRKIFLVNKEGPKRKFFSAKPKLSCRKVTTFMFEGGHDSTIERMDLDN